MTSALNSTKVPQTHYKTVSIGDIEVFYREAGVKSYPALLLLHGFPTSSNMFRNVIGPLSKNFHVIAPDYPGYGFSSMPDHNSFSYTFENCRCSWARLWRSWESTNTSST